MPTSTSSPTNAYAGGLDYDWRLSPMYSISGYLAGTHIERQHRGDHAAAGKQRPRLPASRRRLPRRRPDCDDAAGPRRFGVASARSPARRRASALMSATRRPGFDTNDLGFMRRADERTSVELVPVATTSRRASTCARATSTSTSTPAGTSAATGPIRGGNVNSHWTFTNYYSIGGGSTSTPRRSAIA